MDINNLIQMLKEYGLWGILLFCLIYFILNSEITIKYFPSKRKKFFKNK